MKENTLVPEFVVVGIFYALTLFASSAYIMWPLRCILIIAFSYSLVATLFIESLIVNLLSYILAGASIALSIIVIVHGSTEVYKTMDMQFNTITTPSMLYGTTWIVYGIFGVVYPLSKIFSD